MKNKKEVSIYPMPDCMVNSHPASEGHSWIPKETVTSSDWCLKLAGLDLRNEVLDKIVFHSHYKGSLKKFHIPYIINLYEKIVHTKSDSLKDCYLVIGSSNIKIHHWTAWKSYVRHINQWHDKHPFRFCAIYGINRLFRILLNLYQYFFACKILVVKDFSDVLKRITLDKENQDKHNSDPIRISNDNTQVNPICLQNYIDELLCFINQFQWGSIYTDEETIPHVTSHPFQPVFEAIENVKNKMEEILLERMHAVETLRESEEKYRSILENIEDGYYEVNNLGDLTFFNDSLCRILGYSREELTGMNYRKLADKKTLQKILQLFKTVNKNWKSFTAFDWEFLKKNGKIVYVEASVTLMKNKDDEPIGFRGIVRDISKRKTLETHLLQTSKLESIGELASGISHEINTPIQYIGDNVQFFKDAFRDIDQVLRKYQEILEKIKSGDSSPEPFNSLKNIIQEADLDYLREEIPLAINQSQEGIDRIASIVYAMKEYSHPGLKEKTTIDINQAVKSTIIISRNEWKYVADMKTDFDTSLPHIPCIPGELNQAILNIITNAAHAITDVVGDDFKDKGIIQVKTRKDGKWVKISISDTGPGIPEKIQSRIFDPFFTTKEVGRGTGQGLAISHSVIVSRHGGTIDFKSHEGKGTIFNIRLPIQQWRENNETIEKEKYSLC